ncbi:SDR family NAD(P)-dependent oxidoreductase [Klenkia brasiliensis]|uniref:NAD(P)-dependent dehydrogenase, short-chain alcohol dehydrogenase family n=1 Tax=Klenkia brasiliensis TaxID=333142 RepID=A0A1G7S9Y2_9ACTN|nr:SDR family oxidoreductase [Klenkia brasiliensis]SDG18990.1 NAD(P)-dependent dehydrogenase, short-chain alcohol dehydrogenase family [Klenkia brasiliensis]
MTGTEREGRVGLVTGGASGIGAACAGQLARAGVRVVVADLRLDAARATAATVDGVAVQVDVSQPDSVGSMVAHVRDRFGRLDIAVNNAGVGVPSKKRIADMSDDDWHTVTAVNLDGVFHCLRAELPLMLRAPSGGSIVNVASVMGAVGTIGGAAYVAAKHAVVGLTRTAALEYAADGIRVNAVGPGFVDTPLLGHQDAALRERTAAAHPVGRLATAEEIAAVVCFLASPASSFVTGAFYLADGGYTAV